MPRARTEVGVPLDPEQHDRLRRISKAAKRSARNAAELLLLYGLDHYREALAVPDEPEGSTKPVGTEVP